MSEDESTGRGKHSHGQSLYFEEYL